MTVTWAAPCADTLRVAALPATIVVGLAVIETVGFGDVTVIVTCAVALPLEFVAVTV